MTSITRDQTAEIVHETIAAMRSALGEAPLPRWADANPDERASTYDTVDFLLQAPEAGPDALHERWMAEKVRQGWTWGPVRDNAAKKHPSVVPFTELSDTERRKDAVLVALVRALNDPV